MTFQQLHYLAVLAEKNSINQASQSLFVSQSGVSKAIKQLEEELGFPLLERSSKGVIFTSRGMEFLRDAYGILDRYEALRERYLSSPLSSPVELSVSSQHYIFVAHAVARMSNLLKDHNYTIHLRERKASDIINDVVTRKSQLGFLFYYHINEKFIHRELERFDLEFHFFCDGQPHAYFSDSHPLSARSKVSLSDLEPYPYICYDIDHDPENYAEEIFSPIHPQKSIYVSDRSSMLNIIRHSHGYTLGSGWLMAGYTEPDLVTRPLDIHGDTAMNIGWIIRKGQELDAECQQFLQFCHEAWKECCTGSLAKPNRPRQISDVSKRIILE